MKRQYEKDLEGEMETWDEGEVSEIMNGYATMKNVKTHRKENKYMKEKENGSVKNNRKREMRLLLLRH